MNYLDMVMPFLPEIIKAILFIPVLSLTETEARDQGYVPVFPGQMMNDAGDILATSDLESESESAAADRADAALTKQTDQEDRALDLSQQLILAQQEISKEQIGIARSQEERSTELWNLYKEHYLPGEIAFSKELFAGIRPDLAEGRAVSSVQRQFGNVQGQQEQALRSLGINPSSPRAQSERTRLLSGLASARAGAANIANAQTQDLNRALKAQAVNQGKGLPSLSSNIAASGAGILGQAGSGQLQAGGLQTGLLSGFAGQAGNAAQNALNQQFIGEQSRLAQLQADKARADANRNSLFSSIGQLLGTGIGAFAGPAGAAVGGSIGSQVFSTGGFNPNFFAGTSLQ